MQTFPRCLVPLSDRCSFVLRGNRTGRLFIEGKVAVWVFDCSSEVQMFSFGAGRSLTRLPGRKNTSLNLETIFLPDATFNSSLWKLGFHPFHPVTYHTQLWQRFISRLAEETRTRTSGGRWRLMKSFLPSRLVPPSTDGDTDNIPALPPFIQAGLWPPCGAPLLLGVMSMSATIISTWVTLNNKAETFYWGTKPAGDWHIFWLKGILCCNNFFFVV